MTETQRRIRAYKRALPELRERVIAVALLLVMSLSMLSSASFAWLTLSRAPEVSGMATTVAANGNLEIALASGYVKDGQVLPLESDVGDSSAVDQNIVRANSTWGNLVNVSDPSYGLSNIMLRPALLSDYNRNTNPLYGASYGQDGRVVATTSRYEYSSWQVIDESTGTKGFGARDKTKYGVRAISSIGADSSVGNAILDGYLNNTTTAYTNVASEYQRMINRNSSNVLILKSKRNCITALEGLVGVFAQDKINTMTVKGIDLAPTVNGVSWKNKKMDCSMYIYDVYEMLGHMKKVLEWEGEGLRQMANSQAYSKDSSNRNKFDSLVQTADSTNHLLQYSADDLKAMGIELVSYAGFKKNYEDILTSINRLVNCEIIANTTIGDVTGIEAFAQSDNPNLPEVHYEDIDDSVALLFDMSNTTIGGTKISALSGTTAFSILQSEDNPVVIAGGVLSSFEKRALGSSTQRLNQSVAVGVRANLLGSPTVKGVVTTQSFTYAHIDGDATSTTDRKNTESGGVVASGDAVGTDTYGMALDLWVRTNYPNAVLTLEGSIAYDKEPVTTTISITAGETTTNHVVNVFIGKIQMETTGEDGTVTSQEVEVEVYQLEGDTNWYYISDPGTVANVVGTPIQKMDQIAVGYQGENRIWEDWETLMELGYIQKDATTQGAGSCFVFYADTPPEQAKILELLEAFTIVFLDRDGNDLAYARLDIESAFANQGKVTVPMEIFSGGVAYEYVDEITGRTETRTGIMTMTQNEPTWITAVVFLNGERVQNENVLSDGELQGQMNIQFGTNSVLTAPKNEELQSQYRTITATLSSGSQTSTHATKQPDGSYSDAIALKYNEAGHDVHATLDVQGVQPTRIDGYLVRVISATQGTRTESVSFTQSTDPETPNIWTTTAEDHFKLTSPGTYIMNTLLVDGVQYNLHDGSDSDYPANHPAVTIDGLTLGNVSTDKATGTYMTTDDVFPVAVTATVTSDMGTPSQVSAQFFSQDNSKQYTALMTYYPSDTGGVWKGTANIATSGTYTLKYITVDGQTMEVSPTSQTTLNLYLGLDATLYTDASEEIALKDGETKQAGMYVKVIDGSNNVINTLSDVKLTYRMRGSVEDTDSLNANLTWNGAFYHGEFDIDKSGVYEFEKIEAKFAGTSNTLTQLENEPPVFTVTDFKPPEFSSVYAESYQLAVEKSAELKVSLKNTGGIKTIIASFRHSESADPVVKTGTFQSTSYGIDTYVFNLEQDGVWNVESVSVVKNNETFTFMDENTNDQVSNVETKVVKNVYATATYDGGTLPETITLSGDCLETVTTKTLAVTAVDYESQPVQGLTGLTWTITHTEDDSENSGYSYKVNAWTAENVEISGATASVTERFTYAGNYTSTLKLHFGNTSCDAAMKVVENDTTRLVPIQPKIKLTSAKPTVKVSAISPKAGTSIQVCTNANPMDIPLWGFTGITGDFNRSTEYSATVYIGFEDGSVGIKNAKLPQVTLALSGMSSNFTSASMTFNHATRDDSHRTYTFTPDKMDANNVISAVNSIGYNAGGTGTDNTAPAGKKTIGTISVVNKNNQTIIVTLSNPVTINQPQYPPYVDFASTTNISDVNLPTTPSRIYAEPNADGDLQITLPATQTWKTDGEESTGTGWQSKSDTTEYVYRTWSTGGCDSKTYYVGYERKTVIEESSGSTTTWTNNYSITRWRIGDDEYEPGATVIISSNQTVTAIVSNEITNEVTTSSNLRQTTITYTKTIDQTETKPGSPYTDSGLGTTEPKEKDVKIEKI